MDGFKPCFGGTNQRLALGAGLGLIFGATQGNAAAGMVLGAWLGAVSRRFRVR